MELVRQM